MTTNAKGFTRIWQHLSGNSQHSAFSREGLQQANLAHVARRFWDYEDAVQKDLETLRNDLFFPK